MRAFLDFPLGLSTNSNQSHLDLKGRVMPGFWGQRSHIPSCQEQFHTSNRISVKEREMDQKGRGKYVRLERPRKREGRTSGQQTQEPISGKRSEGLKSRLGESVMGGRVNVGWRGQERGREDVKVKRNLRRGGCDQGRRRGRVFGVRDLKEKTLYACPCRRKMVGYRCTSPKCHPPTGRLCLCELPLGIISAGDDNPFIRRCLWGVSNISVALCALISLTIKFGSEALEH